MEGIVRECPETNPANPARSASGSSQLDVGKDLEGPLADWDGF